MRFRLVGPRGGESEWRVELEPGRGPLQPIENREHGVEILVLDDLGLAFDEDRWKEV